jgi:hypothetical protein
MALYKECGHYGGSCPCILCKDRCYDRCGGCIGTETEEYIVDTDKLCEAAKQYCESGRDDNGT